MAGDTITIKADDYVKISGEDVYVDANDDVNIMANNDVIVEIPVMSSLRVSSTFPRRKISIARMIMKIFCGQG